MPRLLPRHWRFETRRLLAAEWSAAAEENGLDLAQALSAMLTTSTTRSLPEALHGDFSIDRARLWIHERDQESPTLLVIDRQSRSPVGLLILFEVPLADDGGVDLRVGYLLAESFWGQGLGSELVAGLVTWSRSQDSIRTLSAGVEAKNQASRRILVKNGFTQVTDSDDGELIYRLELRRRQSKGPDR